MNDGSGDLWFQAFDCESVPLAEDTPAEPRPPHRPRDGSPVVTEADGILFSFEDVGVPLPPDTPATPRPPGRPREPGVPASPADAAFARELADRVLEYSRSHPAGLTPEQLAALVQHLLARRSA